MRITRSTLQPVRSRRAPGFPPHMFTGVVTPPHGTLASLPCAWSVVALITLGLGIDDARFAGAVSRWGGCPPCVHDSVAGRRGPSGS